MANTAGEIESWQKYDITVTRSWQGLSGQIDVAITMTGDLTDYDFLLGQVDVAITMTGDLTVTP